MRTRVVALVAASVALVSGVVVATGVARATGTSDGPALKAGSPGTFDIVGNVKQRLVLNTAVLSKLPSKTLTVTFKAGSATETHTFTGPLLRDVLDLAARSSTPRSRTTSCATTSRRPAATAIRSWSRGARSTPTSPIRTSCSRSPQDGASLADEGPRLVVPSDGRGGRYVSGVARIRLDRGR